LTDDTKQATPSATKDSEEEAAVTVADQAAQADQPAEATEAVSEAPSTDAAAPETAAATATEPAEEVAVEAQPMEAVSVEATEPVADEPVTVEPVVAESAPEPVAAPDEPAEAPALEAATEAPAPVAEAAPEEESEAPVAESAPAEPMTMAELLDQPDNEVKSLKHGDVVEGTVVRIDPDEILVDFGGKSEGVVSNRELMNRRGPRDGDESRPEIEVGTRSSSTSCSPSRRRATRSCRCDAPGSSASGAACRSASTPARSSRPASSTTTRAA
jgi:hypothetical protein